MRQETKRNIKDLAKFGYVIIAIALFLALRYVYLSYSLDSHVPECEKFVPDEIPLDNPNHVDEDKTYHEEKLNFSEKKRISWRRYGFRRKIEIKQKTIFRQELLENSGMNNIFYGVYRDSELKEPIEEISMKYQLEVAGAKELNEPLDKYPDYVPYLTTVLEPGTYYMAIYSTDPSEGQTVIYQSRKAVVDTDLSLKADKRGYFFSSGKDQKTYFRIYVAEPGALKVDGSFGTKILYDIWLCSADKDTISKATLISHDKEEGLSKMRVIVPKEGVYYLQVSPQTDKIFCHPYEIRYIVE